MSLSTASPEKSSTIERLFRRVLGRRGRGQSFIEAMVAITIIVTSITSALALVQSSINASRVSGTQVIAANLAREGLEVVRAVRDSNWLAGNTFQLGLTDVANKTALAALNRATGQWSLVFGAYTIDSAAATLWQASDGLYLQAAAQPAGTSAAPYARLLTLNHLCRDNTTGAERIVSAGTCNGGETFVGLSVLSTVKWIAGAGAKRQLSAEERLYDWR